MEEETTTVEKSVEKDELIECLNPLSPILTFHWPGLLSLWLLLLILPQIVARIDAIRPTLAFTIQQTTLLESTDRLAHLALREVRAIPEFDLRDAGRGEDRFEDPAFVLRQEVQYSGSWPVRLHRLVRLDGTLWWFSTLSVGRMRRFTRRVVVRVRAGEVVADREIPATDDSHDEYRSEDVPEGVRPVDRTHRCAHHRPHLIEGPPLLVRLPAEHTADDQHDRDE